MKSQVRTYGIFFCCFLAIIVLTRIQNLGNSNTITFLWMNISLSTAILLIGFIGLFQGIFLYLVVKTFFGVVQRSELNKFDLDKPL